VLDIDNVFHMQEEEIGETKKKKTNFEAQQIIENLQKIHYPVTPSWKQILNRGREEGIDSKDCQM